MGKNFQGRRDVREWPTGHFCYAAEDIPTGEAAVRTQCARCKLTGRQARERLEGRAAAAEGAAPAEGPRELRWARPPGRLAGKHGSGH